MIRLEHISKEYYIPHTKKNTLFEKTIGLIKENNTMEKFDALKDISFEIKEGEIFGIIGKNGSGKTTLLKILSGIIPPTSGKVHSTKKITPFLDLGIGFHGELSARENIHLYSAIMGMSRKKVEKELKEILRFAGVERFADMRLRQFSAGMALRLAFSTMIRTEFDVIVLDEVFAVGDYEFKKKCLAELEKFKKMGKTIILTSHGIKEVVDFCDRVMLLENGRIKAIGAPQEVVDIYLAQEAETITPSTQKNEKLHAQMK